jgi:hypothetical protein
MTLRSGFIFKQGTENYVQRRSKVDLVLKNGRATTQAVSRCLLPRSPGFAPGSTHVGFVVDKVVLGQVFLRVLRFPCPYHSTVVLHTHIIRG